MVEPSTSNVNEATAQDTDEDQSKSIMEVEESNEAIEKSSVPTSSSTEPVITTASNVSKVSTLPIEKIITLKNARSWVSMVFT